MTKPLLLVVALACTVLGACGGEDDNEKTRTYPLPEGAYIQSCPDAKDIECTDVRVTL
jgi:hypothetical protein